MPQLIIKIGGDIRDLMDIAGQVSDGGGEAGMLPSSFVTNNPRKYMAFDYSECFLVPEEGEDLDSQDRYIYVLVRHDHDNE